MAGLGAAGRSAPPQVNPVPAASDGSGRDENLFQADEDAPPDDPSGSTIAATAKPTPIPPTDLKAIDALPAQALRDSTSPYLRASLSSPVRWQPFDNHSFALARKLNRPVLIDIGAMWCHWCHVMDEDTYSNAQVAQLINEKFVPIRVDRDRRPDVDHYYQNAAADFDGAGGWPLTCFALPDGALFAAWGYLPPLPHPLAPSDTPSMLHALEQIAASYKNQLGKLSGTAADLEEKLKKEDDVKSAPAAKSPIVEILSGIANAYDHANGGFSFGPGPKFFEFPALELALAEGFWGRHEFAEMAATSLQRMAGGGVYDQLGGGFFRYSTDQAWLVPHFEKLAYDQALALVTYAHAYEIDPRPEYRAVAAGTADYVMNSLFDASNGTFGAAQDADVSAAGDGAYYTWTAAQVRQLLTPQEYRAAARYFGIEAQPALAANGQLVLRRAQTVEQVASGLQISSADAGKLIAGALAKLRAARAKRPPPAVDHSVLIDRNALMDKGFIAAGHAFGDARLNQAALQNLDYLAAHGRAPDGSYYHVLSKRAPVQGLAADQVYMLDALLGAYQASGQARYLSGARELAAVIQRDFIDQTSGLVINHEPAGQAAVLGSWRGGIEAYYDGEMPSLQGVTARDFGVLGVLLNDGQYLKVSARLLRSVPVSARAAMMLATVGHVMADQLHGQPLIVINGNGADPNTQLLLAAAGAAYRPGKILLAIDRTGPGGGKAVSAYVCAGSACSPPTSDPGQLAQAVRTYGLTAHSS